MKYFKYLPTNGWESIPEKTWNYLVEHTDFSGIDDKNWLDLDLDHYRIYVPEIFEIFKPYNLTIDFVAAIKICRPNTFIHIDTTEDTTYRVNIPVLNYLGTSTKFYRSNVQPKQIILKDGEVIESFTNYSVNSILFKEDDCELVTEVCVDKPVILNVKVPHKVSLPNRVYPRITLTIKFKEDITGLIE